MPRWWSQGRNLRLIAATTGASTVIRVAAHGLHEIGFFGFVDAILIVASAVFFVCSFRRDLRNPAWPDAGRDGADPLISSS